MATSGLRTTSTRRRRLRLLKRRAGLQSRCVKLAAERVERLWLPNAKWKVVIGPDRSLNPWLQLRSLVRPTAQRTDSQIIDGPALGGNDTAVLVQQATPKGVEGLSGIE